MFASLIKFSDGLPRFYLPLPRYTIIIYNDTIK
nr:MAG TPA: hypothetical protein [Caudoviricetes sp.]